jgi:hypothetical protein
MTNDSGDQHNMLRAQVELQEREFTLVGSIVAHWGALEHEIFIQTLSSYDNADAHGSSLPNAMRNNTKFVAVLELWKERVVDKAEAGVRAILSKQIEAINALSDFRNALVHGMWHWTPGHPGEIIASRAVRGEYLSVRFPPDALADLAERVQTIYTRVRYPRGWEDLAREISSNGSYVSRNAFDMLFGGGETANRIAASIPLSGASLGSLEASNEGPPKSDEGNQTGTETS